MKQIALSLTMLWMFLGAPGAMAQNGPALTTDKPMYEAGEAITFTGADWAAGEPVTVVITVDGSNEKITLQATADEAGTFTVTAAMPGEEGEREREVASASVNNRGHVVVPDVSQHSNYHATANGAISHSTAETAFSEGERETDGERLLELEGYWHTRLTSPTGKFNPSWVRKAAEEDKKVKRGTPKGRKKGRTGTAGWSVNAEGVASLALSDTTFTALGPFPERMTGCTGCYDYTTTQGRINNIVIDPTTTSNGTIVAYAASVGGGVWKTTNCCSNNTTWAVVTDDPLISTTSIDTLALDPNDHNTIYAGTGDLNYGSFSMGSQGILKSTDAGVHWTVLGADVFGPALPEPVGQFPQYQAVGKVRVDPNNSNNVLAGTKTGLYLSYDGGENWTGPCLTNAFTSQRQDITGLELSNIGGTTRIVAAVGVRGFSSTVQFNLGQNGANGIYKATMPSAGCPSFTSIASNANGFVSGISLNGGSGNAYVSAASGNQLGRIDFAVAPSDPNYIYAQVQSITPINSGGCGNANGCQLGVWVSINGGTSWTMMTGSNGGALRDCASSGVGSSSSAGAGDYPQNWYDQAVAVDPNNKDRVFISTFDVWLATRTGTAFYDVSCGYTGVSPKPVHTDQHALAFVNNSSSMLLLGNDGGVNGTINANVAALNTARPTWFNMDKGFNTIEFYSGDISGNFANATAPQASGGAQDNGPSSATFAGSPTGPVQWQMGLGGDGFYSRIDPVGTGASLRFWQGNNSGGLSRCISNCTAGGASWTSKRGAWTGDQQSFILPFDLFRGGIPGGDDCPAAATNGGCGRLLAGTTRVWETITGNAANSSGTVTWYVTNNPTTSNLTKGTLGNRSFINQVKYSPKTYKVAIAGTNDANVQIGFNLGTGTQAQATWVNVTGGNTVLPNRPVLGIALDPSQTTAPIGYAAVGGFNANTPTMPGHVFRVVCNTSCASFTWADKSGNLPDIPVDSIIVNPNFPPQVFAGTDFGLYYTDDITATVPVWQRFSNGLPAVMIWDMQIDRGSTTLSLWTRGRGAYVWPLTLGPENPLPTLLTVSPVSVTYGGSATLTATLSSGGNPVPTKSIEFRLNGTLAGTAVTDGSGTATLNIASVTSVNAGVYGSGVNASFTADSIYDDASDDASLTVAAKPITVTAVSDSKTYDGSASSSASPSIAPGLAGSDTSGFIQSFDSKNAGTGKTLSASGAPIDGNGGNNYSVTFVDDNGGSILALSIMGSITADDKQYDGNTSASIASRSLSGVIAPDDVAYTGGAATFSDKNVDTAKTVTATGLGLSGADAGNYTVNSSATATADITARPLTITATGIDKQYDGNTAATVTLSDDRVAGDVLTTAYASAQFADADAGTNKPVSVTGISISGPDAGNYTFNTTASTTANIGSKLLTVTATGIDKVYDGTTVAAVVLSDNRVAGDVLTASYASAAFADPNAGNAKPVSVSGISLSGPDAGNYAFNASAMTTANIFKAALTVTANGASRLYGYPNPTFTASYSGFVNGETLATSGVTGAPSLTTSATQASAAGTYTIAAGSGSLAAGNYSFGFVNGTLTIYLSGIVGLDSVSIGANKALVDSFTSSGGYPATMGSSALILSNGHVGVNGAKISGSIISSRGSVDLGPGTEVTGSVTAGAAINNKGTVAGAILPNEPSGLIVANAVPNCGAFTSNPGVSGGKFTYSNGDLAVSANSTVTLASGTYCFQSLTLSGNATLQVSGPVVINLTGPLHTSGGSLVNTTQVPSNLQIATSYTGGAGVTIAGNTSAYLTVYAPGTDVTITGGSPVFGALLGKTLTVSGNSQVHYDVLLPQIWAGFGF